MTSRWAQSALNPPRAFALGMRLQPLTLGHVLAMLRDCPSVIEGDEMGVADFVTGVFICSHPTAEDYERTSRSRLCWLVFAVWNWSIRVNKMNVVEEADKFTAYLSSSLDRQPSIHRDSARNIESHGQLAMLALAMMELGLSERDAVNMPIARLNALITAALEVQGKVELWGEGHQELWDLAQSRAMSHSTN